MFLSREYCRHCEDTTDHHNGHCTKCRAREERERVAKWNALTTEEKLQDLRRRIERLEAGPPTY